MYMNKSKKKFIKVGLVAVIIVTISSLLFMPWVGFFGRRECPQAWFQDDMPSFPKNSSPEDRQYMIINGESVSPKDMDISWVKRNCNIKEPSVVF